MSDVRSSRYLRTHRCFRLCFSFSIFQLRLHLFVKHLTSGHVGEGSEPCRGGESQSEGAKQKCWPLTAALRSLFPEPKHPTSGKVVFVTFILIIRSTCKVLVFVFFKKDYLYSKLSYTHTHTTLVFPRGISTSGHLKRWSEAFLLSLLGLIDIGGPFISMPFEVPPFLVCPHPLRCYQQPNVPQGRVDKVQTNINEVTRKNALAAG